MKKIISVFFAILMVMAMMVPAFAAFGDYANKSYKMCMNTADTLSGKCGVFNDIDATTCKKCNGALDENHYRISSRGEHDLPLDKNGHEKGNAYVRCPECDWVNTYIPTDKDGVCRYCDATIPNWLELRFFVEYGANCNKCGKYTSADEPTCLIGKSCMDCGGNFTEDTLKFYTEDPLDPEANWDERPNLGIKVSFFDKLAQSFSNFFAKIAEFFKMIGNAIGSIFK